jgi:hypothetical protein
MCDLGCDRLYELGYIYIDDDKKIHLNEKINLNDPIKEYYQANYLNDKKEPKVLSYLKPENMKYIKYHRSQIL